MKTLLSGFFSLALLLAGGQLMAQCNQSGQVIDLSSNSGCGKVILSYDNFEILAPVNSADLTDIAVGSEIQFSYTLDSVAQACSVGLPINLDCVEVTGLPPADCDAGFVFQAEFSNGYPEVAFQPTVLVSTNQYSWDFGDGESGEGAVANHVFPFQGTYDVCLTVSNGNCGEVVGCQTVDLNECRAAFSYESNDGVVTFQNLSSGNYTDWKWALGNGAEVYDTILESYNYGETNIYTVCLTVWNNNGCSSQYCDYVFSGSGDVCDFTTCVYPGDANYDGAANVYDLLPIGVGFGTEGPPRQVNNVDPTLDWSPQYAPDWGLETINGNDYKHLDCNGDGHIDGDDVEAIEVNYTAPSDVFMVQADGAPTFWLDFEWDTILIDDNTPATIELEADLMAGSPGLPMTDLRGFALQLDYPEDQVQEGGVEVDYSDNSFFGNSNHIIWLQKDRYEDGGEFDLGFTKKSAAADGFGKIATIKFIVISDVLARGQSSSPFTVSIGNVVAVNPEGAMLTVGDLLPSTVYVVNKITTGTKNEWLNSQVAVFPNPATDQVVVQVNDLKAERLDVYNSLGQQVHTNANLSNTYGFNISGWERGVYLVKITTDQGIASKRLVVQ